ncbi:hypothetical protein ACIQFZ_42655 [Streptomyces sp. NPDC093064]|uniref:hypothetical protein n=1 Tax=Streptomyces sp. NPDC093064 TaxID=3366020 RepID=UPI0037F5486A
MSTPQRKPSAYHDAPTAMVFDLLAETATRLIGRYNHLSETATTKEELDAWWEKVIRLRDAKRAVPAQDPDQLIARIQEWTEELELLESADRD